MRLPLKMLSLPLSVALVAAPTAAFAAQPTTALHTATAAADATYGDADVVALLVFGTGPIADKHPDLVAALDTNRTAAPSTPRSAIEEFTTQLMQLDPSFHDVVTLGVQENDPYAAQAALSQLNSDIGAWQRAKQIKLQRNPGAVAASSVWVATKEWLAVETTVVGAWQVAGITTAAAVGEAVIVAAIVPAAVSYQFVYKSADEIQVANWSAKLASTF